VVGVEERHEPAGGVLQAGVARAGALVIAVVLEEPDLARRDVRAEHFFRPVRRAVVDDQDLVIRERLPQDGAERPGEQALPVVRRNDYREEGAGLHAVEISCEPRRVSAGWAATPR